VVLWVAASFIGVSDDLTTFVSVLAPGILIPIWAIWLGVGFAPSRLETA
jgi:hypothetical protein